MRTRKNCATQHTQTPTKRSLCFKKMLSDNFRGSTEEGPKKQCFKKVHFPSEKNDPFSHVPPEVQTQNAGQQKLARIAEWSVDPIDLGDQGELIVQSPFVPTKENMRQHRNFMDITTQSVAQGTSIAQVGNFMTMTDEATWLIPPMRALLQYQGTNTRALCYHLLQCREDSTTDPQLNETTIRRVIEGVGNDQWLQLESGDVLKSVKDVLNLSRLSWIPRLQ